MIQNAVLVAACEKDEYYGRGLMQPSLKISWLLLVPFQNLSNVVVL